MLVIRVRACLHGVGDPGLLGLVSFVFTLWGTQNKRNLPYPTKPGSPTPCKQGLSYQDGGLMGHLHDDIVLLLKPHLHYTKKWARTHKKVGTDQIFLPCKPSVPCFYEMGPDSLFSGFGAIGGYGPKTEKKRVRTPFPDRKRCVNASSFRTIRTLFFM